MTDIAETLRAYQTLTSAAGEREARQWLSEENATLWRLMGKNDITNGYDGAAVFIKIVEGDDHLCGWCHWQGNAHGTLWCPDCGDLLVINRFAPKIRNHKPGLGCRWPNGKHRRDGSSP